MLVGRRFETVWKSSTHCRERGLIYSWRGFGTTEGGLAGKDGRSALTQLSRTGSLWRFFFAARTLRVCEALGVCVLVCGVCVCVCVCPPMRKGNGGNAKFTGFVLRGAKLSCTKKKWAAVKAAAQQQKRKGLDKKKAADRIRLWRHASVKQRTLTCKPGVHTYKWGLKFCFLLTDH